MTNTISYHEAAITYNAELAIRAEQLAETVPDDTVQKWCRSVGKQHRKHQRLHERSLARLMAELNDEVEGVDVTNNVFIINTPTPSDHDVLKPFATAVVGADEAVIRADVETGNIGAQTGEIA